MISKIRSSFHVFLALALILAGASPACKFISGQYDVLQICGALGLKTIVLPAEQSPSSDKTDHHKRNDCAFCHTAGAVKIIQPAPVILTMPVSHVIDVVRITTFDIIKPKISEIFSPRGPPAHDPA